MEDTWVRVILLCLHCCDYWRLFLQLLPLLLLLLLRLLHPTLLYLLLPATAAAECADYGLT